MYKSLVDAEKVKMYERYDHVTIVKEWSINCKFRYLSIVRYLFCCIVAFGSMARREKMENRSGNDFRYIRHSLQIHLRCLSKTRILTQKRTKLFLWVKLVLNWRLILWQRFSIKRQKIKVLFLFIFNRLHCTWPLIQYYFSVFCRVLQAFRKVFLDSFWFKNSWSLAITTFTADLQLL